MRYTAFVIALLSSAAHAQGGYYGGPPMWDRDYREYRPPQIRQMHPRPWGPQMRPCIYYNDCQGPPPRYERPPFEPRPPRYDDGGEE